MPKKISKYQNKNAYQYTFSRCSHMREGVPATRLERFTAYTAIAGDPSRLIRTTGKVHVCTICNTMQGKALHVRTFDDKTGHRREA